MGLDLGDGISGGLQDDSEAAVGQPGEGDEDDDVIDIDDPEELARKGLKRIQIEGEDEEYLLDLEGNIYNLKGEFVGTTDGDVEAEQE